MRLPLRHPPPTADPPRLRCAHLEALAQAAIGLPLGPAADMLCGPASRGRHGNALEWHFGLDPRNVGESLDWEDRIEIKLVTVWLQSDGARPRLVCDKLKVCDLSIDPWRKLSNVLFVFADRVTRVVVGHCFFWLGGEVLADLRRSWRADPHFGRPDLFVESREHGGRASPAYYVGARWLAARVLVECRLGGVLPFDSAWWARARAVHSNRRDPLIVVVHEATNGIEPCPRCAGTVRFDPRLVVERGWAPAVHAMPLGDPCALRAHLVVNGDRLARPPTAAGHRELLEGVQQCMPADRISRLSDRVEEPEDHLH